MNNMGRGGPFSRPPGFPNGGGRNPGVVSDRNLGPQFNTGGAPGGQPGNGQGGLPGAGGGPSGGGQMPGFGGAPMPAGDMPWLQAWEGPFAAPMSPWETQGLQGISQFADEDFGLGDASDYLHQVLGGDFLNGNNPNFDEIQSSGETLKQMEDDRVLKELQSRAAAGGNALSGALLGQESDYMRGSNAQFQNMMAQLRAANYARERGFQQDAVRGSAGISNARLGGYGALMGAGAVPRGIADQELRGQYGDFLRQGQDFRDAYRYPDELMLATMRQGYPGSHQELFGESDASQLSALLAQIFGGTSGLGSGISDFLGGLLGGGGEQPAPSGDGIGYDGEPSLQSLPPAEPSAPMPAPNVRGQRRQRGPMQMGPTINGVIFGPQGTGERYKAMMDQFGPRPNGGGAKGVYDWDARLAAMNPGHMDPAGNRVVNAAGAGHGAPVSVVSPTGQVSGFTGGGIVNGRPGSAPISQTPIVTQQNGQLGNPNRIPGLLGALYDGEEGPSSYKDAGFYNAALTQAQRANAERRANPGKANNGAKAMMILALLAQVLGLGKRGGGSSSRKSGGGGSLGSGLGDAARKGLDSLFGGKKLAAGPTFNPKTGQVKGKISPDRLQKTGSQPEDFLPGSDLNVERYGDSTDWASHSDYSGSDIDSQLFGDGEAGDIWDRIFGGDNEFGNLGGYGSEGGGFDPALGGGAENPNTSDMGGFSLGDSGDIFGGNSFGGYGDGGGSGIDFGDGGWDPGSVEYID